MMIHSWQMSEYLSRLKSAYKLSNYNDVTPAQIQKAEEGKTIWTADDIFNNLDSEVIKIRFTSHHGNLKINQKRRFIHNVKHLLSAGYQPKDLIKINEDCINKNGTIDEKKFEDILANGGEI